MPCKSCVEKWTKYYVTKKFSEEQARIMAEKLVQRVEQRMRKEKTSRFQILRAYLYRWIFQTNWKATVFWRRWIGKSHNPDYTQACTQGTCVKYTAFCDAVACVTSSDCLAASCSKTGDCGCPAPLANSTKVSDCSLACGATGTCGTCVRGVCKNTCGVTNCTTGTCGYNCNLGYVWNGTACVPAVKKPSIMKIDKGPSPRSKIGFKRTLKKVFS
jgi:hypothetical protein